MSWEVKGFMPILDVDDLDAAIGFYESLGFREAWRYPEGLGATHAGVCQGDVTIMLAKGTGARQNVYAFVEGVAAMHAQCRGAQPDRVGALERADYGMLDFSVRDPWGHVLTFGEGDEG